MPGEIADLMIAERLGTQLHELRQLPWDDVERGLGYLDGIDVAHHQTDAPKTFGPRDGDG